jgi:hypothetical protein
MQVLGHDTAFAPFREWTFEIVLHGHGVTGEWNHAGTMVPVPMFEWGGQ